MGEVFEAWFGDLFDELFSTQELGDDPRSNRDPEGSSESKVLKIERRKNHPAPAFADLATMTDCP